MIPIDSMIFVAGFVEMMVNCGAGDVSMFADSVTEYAHSLGFNKFANGFNNNS